MQNAREFLDQVADQLRAKGRQVEIIETEESFGKFVWLSATAPHWYGRTMTLSATQWKDSGRWRLGPLRVASTPFSTGFQRRTRSAIRIAVDVYA